MKIIINHVTWKLNQMVLKGPEPSPIHLSVREATRIELVLICDWSFSLCSRGNMNAMQRMFFYFVLSSYTLCSIESLRDYSCAIATPAGRGKLEQPQLLPAKPVFLIEWHCMSSILQYQTFRVATSRILPLPICFK